MRLEKIATISIGMTFRKRINIDEDGSIGLIQLKDLKDNWEVNLSQVIYLQEDGPIKRYLIQEGDILLRSRGANFMAALVGTLPDDTSFAAASPLVIIRPDRKIVIPEFLLWLINQEKTQKQIQSRSEGTALRLVKRENLANLDMNIPDFDKQKMIAKVTFLQKQEKILLERIVKKRAQMLDKILMRCASG